MVYLMRPLHNSIITADKLKGKKLAARINKAAQDMKLFLISEGWAVPEEEGDAAKGEKQEKASKIDGPRHLRCSDP